MHGRSLTLSLAVALAVAGCSGGGSLDTPEAIADKLGCASTYRDAQTDELGVDLIGRCRFEGQTVRLITFASGQAQGTYLEIATGFGGWYVEGDGYLVEVKGADAERAAESKLG